MNSTERKLRQKYRYGELKYIPDVYLEFETRANHTDEAFEGLEKGQCRFDYETWCKRLGLTKKKMEKAIKNLRCEDKAIEQIERGKKGKQSRYFLTRYMEKNLESNLEHNKRTIGIDITTFAECEGEEMEKKKENNLEHSSIYSNPYIKSINNYTSDSNEYRLAEYLYKNIKKNNPNFKEPNFQKWAKIFDYILRIDNRKMDEVKDLIKFAQQHSFWLKNILSPESLRKQYDRLILEMRSEETKTLVKSQRPMIPYI